MKASAASGVRLMTADESPSPSGSIASVWCRANHSVATPALQGA